MSGILNSGLLRFWLAVPTAILDHKDPPYYFATSQYFWPGHSYRISARVVSIASSTIDSWMLYVSFVLDNPGDHLPFVSALPWQHWDHRPGLLGVQELCKWGGRDVKYTGWPVVMWTRVSLRCPLTVSILASPTQPSLSDYVPVQYLQLFTLYKP